MQVVITTETPGQHSLLAGGLTIPECSDATVAGVLRTLDRDNDKLIIRWHVGDLLPFVYDHPGMSIGDMFTKLATLTALGDDVGAYTASVTYTDSAMPDDTDDGNPVCICWNCAQTCNPLCRNVYCLE